MPIFGHWITYGEGEDQKGTSFTIAANLLDPADDDNEDDDLDLEIEDPNDTGFPVPSSMSEGEDGSAASSRSWESHGTPVEQMQRIWTGGSDSLSSDEAPGGQPLQSSTPKTSGATTLAPMALKPRLSTRAAPQPATSNRGRRAVPNRELKVGRPPSATRNASRAGPSKGAKHDSSRAPKKRATKAPQSATTRTTYASRAGPSKEGKVDQSRAPKKRATVAAPPSATTRNNASRAGPSNVGLKQDTKAPKRVTAAAVPQSATRPKNTNPSRRVKGSTAAAAVASSSDSEVVLLPTIRPAPRASGPGSSRRRPDASTPAVTRRKKRGGKKRNPYRCPDNFQPVPTDADSPYDSADDFVAPSKVKNIYTKENFKYY